MKFSLRTILIAALILPAVGAWIYLDTYPPLIPVVVANQDLDAWTELTTENTDVELWPTKAVSNGLAHNPNFVTGKYLKHRLSRGMAVSNDQFDSLEEIVELLTTRLPAGLFNDRENVDDFIFNTPQLGCNIVTVDCLSKTDAIGLSITRGDRVRICLVKDGIEREIANNVLVLRDCQPKAGSPLNATRSIRVVLDDAQSIDYLQSKREGCIQVYPFAYGG